MDYDITGKPMSMKIQINNNYTQDLKYQQNNFNRTCILITNKG